MFLYANGRQFILYFSFTLGLEDTSGGWGWIYVLYQHKHTKKGDSSLGAKVRTRKDDHPNRRKVKKSERSDPERLA